MQKILLYPLLKCTNLEQLAVLELRNSDEVRKYMYTDHIISENEHKDWLKTLAQDKKQIVYAVKVDDCVSGVVSVNNMDQLHKKTDWAFYLDEKVRGGLGAALECFFIDYVFNNLGMEKLNCEVLEINPAVVKMHQKFGFKEEGFRRQNIIKEDKRIGVHLLGMTKDEWNENSESIAEKYQKVLNKFDVQMGMSHEA